MSSIRIQQVIDLAKRSWVFLTFFCVAWVQPLAKANAFVPLQYYSHYGIYTAPIHVGTQPTQTLEAIVDTGSAVLVLVTVPEYCASCTHSLTKGRVDPKKIKQNSNETRPTLKIGYGSADVSVKEYNASVFFPKEIDKRVLMNVYLIQKSTEPTSILGLIPHNLKGDPIHSTPFIRKYTHNFYPHPHLLFVLCAEKGQSFLQIGDDRHLPKPKAMTRLYLTPFYEINVSGFYDDQDQPIATTQHAVNPAVLDTGTGGFIVLSARLYKPLMQYLYDHANQQNAHLNSEFWGENACVPQNQVNYAAFPPLKLGIAPLEKGPSNFLTLSSQTYINRAGCPQNTVRLIFNLIDPPAIFTAMRNDKVRKAHGRTPEMIIGTALLNHYAFKVHFEPNPSISFYANETLCTKSPVAP